jgi:penicillin G amidase
MSETQQGEAAHAPSVAPSAPSARPRRGCLGCLGMAAVWGLLAVVVLASVAVGGGTYFVQRTLPTTAGTLNVPGLNQTATVVRDRWGVPYITASNDHDVFFAQGYVTAQDRLFQMEFNRRVAAGRLAEMFGAGSDKSVLQADEFLRTLGLYQAGQNEYDNAAPDVKVELDAYAAGVNAFLDQHADSLPLEFTILGITPQRWSPVDTVAYGRVVALSLDTQWETKYTRALLVAKLGVTAVDALYPAYLTSNPTLIGADGKPAPLRPGAQLQGTLAPSRASTQATAAHDAITHLPLDVFAALSPGALRGVSFVRALLGGIGDALGSNDWVVDGSKTTTGMPLLANDPHLGIREPAIWYQVALRAPNVDVIGFSFPGVPGVIIGHNEDIAWGVTNVGADDTDLYLERLDPIGHPGQYLFQGSWEPLITRTETIKVRGGPSETITVRATTEHGPLLDSVVADVKPLTSSTTALALKWTALQPGSTFTGFFQLDRARDWASFRAALANISISQNFVYADRQNNIGYQMSGWLPLRTAANDLLPVPGDDGRHEWTGIVPADKLPSLFDPPTHVIATANNQIVPDSYPTFVTSVWDYGYRARRIIDLLTSAPTLSIADYQRIQNDVYSVPAAQLVPLFVAAGQAAGGDAAAGAKLLATWDDQMTRGSAAAALYEVALGTLAREVLEPALGKQLYATYTNTLSISGLTAALIGLMHGPIPPFFNASTIAQVVTVRNGALARALADAMHQLRTALGSDPTQWRWGALHQASFAHPLASVSPLNLVFGIPAVERPGDGTTVNVGGDFGFSADPPHYDQTTIPSMRQIIDLSNFDQSLWVIPAGESGQPLSPHYSDLLPLWDQGRYESMVYSSRAIGSVAVDVLVLKP